MFVARFAPAPKVGLCPALVKAQLGTVCTLATSLSNETEAKALAQSYGAATLLDKMTLYTDMVPAIRRYQPKLQNIQQRPGNEEARLHNVSGAFSFKPKILVTILKQIASKPT